MSQFARRFIGPFMAVLALCSVAMAHDAPPAASEAEVLDLYWKIQKAALGDLAAEAYLIEQDILHSPSLETVLQSHTYLPKDQGLDALEMTHETDSDTSYSPFSPGDHSAVDRAKAGWPHVRTRLRKEIAWGAHAVLWPVFKLRGIAYFGVWGFIEYLEHGPIPINVLCAISPYLAAVLSDPLTEPFKIYAQMKRWPLYHPKRFTVSTYTFLRAYLATIGTLGSKIGSAIGTGMRILGNNVRRIDTKQPQQEIRFPEKESIAEHYLEELEEAVSPETKLLFSFRLLSDLISEKLHEKYVDHDSGLSNIHKRISVLNDYSQLLFITERRLRMARLQKLDGKPNLELQRFILIGLTKNLEAISKRLPDLLNTDFENGDELLDMIKVARKGLNKSYESDCENLTSYLHITKNSIFEAPNQT